MNKLENDAEFRLCQEKIATLDRDINMCVTAAGLRECPQHVQCTVMASGAATLMAAVLSSITPDFRQTMIDRMLAVMHAQVAQLDEMED